MRARSAWVCAFTLAAVFVAGAQPYLWVDSGSVPEPWSGWWWPEYDGGPDSGPYLWQGGGGRYGDDPGPIYDLDTRYFWWQGPRRTRAQALEYEAHRTTDPNHKSWGHCHGVSFAQALEAQPPADNGALSRDDLEGLLSELYCWCAFKDETEHDVGPGDLWSMLQWYLGPSAPDSGAVVVDFCRLLWNGQDVGWNWPVYGYRAEYNLSGPILDYAKGVMTLFYEDHKFNTVNAPDSAKFGFWCKMNGPHTPRPGTGDWDTIILAPCDPPNPATPPDIAFKPTVRQTAVWDSSVNYWLWSDSAETTGIRRVIDYKTIIFDDAFPVNVVRWLPFPPPGGDWEQRPVGYGGSCWSAPTNPEVYHELNWMIAYPPGGKPVPTGTWNVFVWKPQPYNGEQLTDTVAVSAAWGHPHYEYYRQDTGPYEQWVPLTTRSFGLPYMYLYQGSLWQQEPSRTYYDAYRLEYVGGGGEGGASSAAVALGDASQLVRVTPNPVGRTARISYIVSKPGPVDVVVYDVTGRAVLRAAQGIQRAGVQAANLSVAGLPAGTYMARVSVNDVNTTCRFVVCR